MMPVFYPVNNNLSTSAGKAGIAFSATFSPFSRFLSPSFFHFHFPSSILALSIVHKIHDREKSGQCNGIGAA